MMIIFLKDMQNKTVMEILGPIFNYTLAFKFKNHNLQGQIQSFHVPSFSPVLCIGVTTFMKF